METWEKAVMIFIIVMFLVLGFLFASAKSFNSGYRLGQIDALIGKVKYELKQKDNNELKWEEIKNKD